MSLLRLTAIVRRSSALKALLAALPAATLLATQARADTSALTELVDAAAQRLQVAEAVAAYKWNAHVAVEDPDRVQQQLAKLSADAAGEHIDPSYVSRVFGDQINATEAIEHTRFAEWKLNPANAPAGAPDLSVSRSTIDGLNQTMLNQMVIHWDLLHSPSCVPQLDAARAAVTRARLLDRLYQQALALATQSYCT
ncbi:gamma subclass chorismate mutase AroQ [Mycobacterium ahvazicum]|uniref:Chorismate mutase n=1 Tax=Mycobacterium ahvazicum TaxID=1964395 RepID=A0A2K4YBP8_9MYCO|nr:chorismate mutase [Mycobacterium ahvazicum]SOX54204.1 gamma subclass chorismate mutase AroQ [Mycobacterium ahvazicum]